MKLAFIMPDEEQTQLIDEFNAWCLRVSAETVTYAEHLMLSWHATPYDLRRVAKTAERNRP